jgi:hypothetical protein
MHHFRWLGLVVCLGACSEAVDVDESGGATQEVTLGLDCSPYAGVDEDTRFSPAAGKEGSEAVGLDDPRIVGWATAVTDYAVGDGVDEQWTDPKRGLGVAAGDAFDVVALGEGGQITLGFEPPISNGSGADFAVFENAFSDDFLELAWVDVSSDGKTFLRFPAISLVSDPVGAYGTIDPRLVDGFAGKYRQGYGTPFDLSLLEEQAASTSGTLDLSSIRAVRLVDVSGDGRDLDCHGRPTYDPYPTTGSAGFDLDAIAVLHRR